MAKRLVVGSRMSQAVVHGGFVYIAGQTADNRKASLEEQTCQVLDKIEALMKEAGGSKSTLMSVEVFLPNIVDFDAMNKIYDAWIDPANPPSRACIEARLADSDLKVEMSAVGFVE